MSQLPPISSLMSPPEIKPLDSFTSPSKHQIQSSISRQSSFTPENTLPPMHHKQSPAGKSLRVLPSPPVSPWTTHENKASDNSNPSVDGLRAGERLRDPVLYPGTDSGGGETTIEPLFPSSPDNAYVDQVITKHMAAVNAQFDKKVNRPTADEYRLAVSFCSNIGRSFNQNPGAYMKRQREETDEYYARAKRICGLPISYEKFEKARLEKLEAKKPLTKLAPAPVTKGARKPPQIRKVTNEGKPFVRVRKPKALPSTPSGLDSSSDRRSGTPDAKVGAAKRPEDLDFASLPDYCPPLDSLPPNRPKFLHVEWSCVNMLDLGHDPHRHLLHEAELVVASTLRLSCATYLCSKRRIFEARLNKARVGKEFRKTDAQQACKIDVNKASKLWVAYDRVGWFDRKWIQQWL